MGTHGSLGRRHLGRKTSASDVYFIFRVSASGSGCVKHMYSVARKRKQANQTSKGCTWSRSRANTHAFGLVEIRTSSVVVRHAGLHTIMR
jgi:hypothetical protein